MANGKFAYGQRLQNVNWNIGNDLLNSEDQEFKHRAEDRLVADRKAAAQAAKEAAKKAGLDRAKALKLYDTGSDSLNQSLAEGVSIATSEYNPVFEILDDTSGKYSQQDKIAANVKLQNLQTFPENTKILTESLMKEYQTYQKDVAEGKVFRDEDYEAKFQNGFKGITISVDDEGMPMAIFKGKRDVNKDGKVDELDVENLKSLQDAYARPQFMNKYSWDSMVKGHISRLESAVNKTDNGVTSVTTTGVEDDLLKQSVKKALYKEDGSLSNVMLSFLRQRGLDPNKPEDVEKVKNDYLNDVYLGTERGKKTDVDTSASIALKNANKSDKPEVAPGANITLNVDEKGNPVTPGEKGGEGKRKDTYSFVINPTGQKAVQIGDKQIKIQEYILDENNEISYKGVAQIWDPDKYLTVDGETDGGGFNKTELALAARAEGFKDSEEFKNFLIKTRDERLGKNKPKATYTKEQESSISENMTANPDYTREEIIEALGLNK